jgi:hypothetical protein
MPSILGNPVGGARLASGRRGRKGKSAAAPSAGCILHKSSARTTLHRTPKGADKHQDHI